MDLGHMNVVCLFVCFEVDVFACWDLIEAHISAPTKSEAHDPSPYINPWRIQSLPSFRGPGVELN